MQRLLLILLAGTSTTRFVDICGSFAQYEQFAETVNIIQGLVSRSNLPKKEPESITAHIDALHDWLAQVEKYHTGFNGFITSRSGVDHPRIRLVSDMSFLFSITCFVSIVLCLVFRILCKTILRVLGWMIPYFAQGADKTVSRLANRGISLKQMLRTYEMAIEASTITEGCTTAEFAEKVVMPATKDAKTSYVEHLEKVRKKPSRPCQTHVVHSWRMKLQDLLLACARYAIDDTWVESDREPSAKELLSIDWHETHAPENLRKTFFVCMFAVNQHKVKSPTMPLGHSCCEIDKFDLVARHINKRTATPMVIAVDAEWMVFSRACCLDEVHAAVKHKIPIKMFGARNLAKPKRSDAMYAEAYDQRQRYAIFKKIDSLKGGFDQFNSVINVEIDQFVAQQHKKFDRALKMQRPSAPRPAQDATTVDVNMLAELIELRRRVEDIEDLKSRVEELEKLRSRMERIEAKQGMSRMSSNISAQAAADEDDDLFGEHDGASPCW